MRSEGKSNVWSHLGRESVFKSKKALSKINGKQLWSVDKM